MTIKPLGDRAVLKRIDAEEKTAGGILLPETAKEKPQECEVLYVGEGARDESGKRIPMEIKAGDHVLINKWGGTEMKIDGQEVIIVKESDILAIVQPSAAKKKAA